MGKESDASPGNRRPAISSPDKARITLSDSMATSSKASAPRRKRGSGGNQMLINDVLCAAIA
jgi:hypothetical protein